MTIPREVVIYAAGFFDGEGHVRVYHYGYLGRGQVRIQIGQIVRAPLDYLQVFFGGQIYTHIKKRGHLIYNWHLTGSKAEEFLRLIEPYLLVKGPDVRQALERTTISS